MNTSDFQKGGEDNNVDSIFKKPSGENNKPQYAKDDDVGQENVDQNEEPIV